MIDIKVPKPRKLPSGNYFIQLRIGGKSQSITDPDEATCIARAVAIKAGILEEEKRRAHPTLSVAIDKYIEARSNALSPSTIYGYRSIQRTRFMAAMQEKVDAYDQAGWQRLCNQEAKICSAKTLKNAWCFVSSVIYEETGKRYDIRLPQVVPNEHPFLEPEQIEPFLNAVKGTPIEIPALLALSSLRRSEILALTWDRIDLKKRLIFVRGAAVYDETHTLVQKKSNKNRSSTRTVPIFIDQLYQALAAIPNKTGRVMTLHPNSIWVQVNRICKAASLPPVGVHGLRHSFASLGYHLGIPEKIIMEIGGWEDDKTMRKIYTHIARSDIAHYGDQFSKFFNQGKE